MMPKQVIVFLFSILVAQINSTGIHKIKNNKLYFKPLDLIDDANKALDDLGQIILGNILAAHDELDNYRFDVVSHTVNVRLNSEVDAEQEHQSLYAELVTLKELAESANANISSCLNGNEDDLESLPDRYLDQINMCIANTSQESDSILTDSRYRVDVYINEVQALNFALGQCGSDEGCISDLIDQINQSGTDLPLQIKAEVLSASEKLEIVKVKIQDCSNTGLADYVLEGSGILDDITACVNRIIS